MSEKKDSNLNNWFKKRKKITIGFLTIILIIFMIIIVDFPKFIQPIWGRCDYDPCNLRR